MIEIYNNNNEKVKCELLFTFEKNNKRFVIYQDEEDEILASYYIIKNDKMIIMPITDDKDYDIVDIELEKWWNEDE